MWGWTMMKGEWYELASSTSKGGAEEENEWAENWWSRILLGGRGEWVERRKRINNGLALGGVEAFFEGKGKGEMQ